MAYRLKVTFRTNGKDYYPGDILPDNISEADLIFLKSKKFIEPADVDKITVDEPEEDEEELFGGEEPESLKSKDEIEKLRKKEDVYAYAKSIGCDLGEDYDEKPLKDLKNEVINYQEQEEAESNFTEED